ncbi:MAG: hypothetical protein HUU21_12975 [Polyangiaceae bacterium]|nr:hypothetical protein [Polyangiaceae bacterium]
MSNETTRPDMGQDHTNPSPEPLTDTLAEIRDALRSLKVRFDAMEMRFEYLDRDCLKAIRSTSLPVPEHLIGERPEDEPEVDPVPDPVPEEPHVPTLALASDGRVLLSLHYLAGADITGRERWAGIFLNDAEIDDALVAMSDAADDTASHIGGAIIARAKRERGNE